MSQTATAYIEREAYNRDGFVIVRSLLSVSEVADIRDTFMRQAAHGPVEGLSDRARITDPADPLSRYPRMMNPHRHADKPVGPLAMRHLLDPRSRLILRELLDDEPIAAQSMFYFKPPGARGQDLHQDNFYLRVQPGTCMAAWIAIDDADAENGGMVVVPGTHILAVQCPRESDRSKFFTGDRVDPPAGASELRVDLQAGDALFFNGSLIHGSYSNTSRDRFRRALILHYVPAACHEVADWYAPLYDFDGNVVLRDFATGGGPCGNVVPGNAQPH